MEWYIKTYYFCIYKKLHLYSLAIEKSAFFLFLFMTNIFFKKIIKSIKIILFLTEKELRTKFDKDKEGRKMGTTKKKMLLADLSLAIVAVIWGTGFIVTKSILSGVGPLYMVALRFLIATLVIGIFSFKKLKTITSSDLKGGLVVGFMLFFGFITQTIGIQHTTVGKSAFLTGTNVVMVPFILAIFYKKMPDIYATIAAGLCFLGVSLLTIGMDAATTQTGNFNTFNPGDIWTIACALGFALQIITNSIFVKKMDASILTFIQFAVVTVLGFVVAYIFEGPIVLPSGSTIWGLFYLGVVSTCVAFFVQTLAQKYTTATHTAIILSMEALFGTLFGIAFLSEPFTLIMGIGCAAIFLAIITAETQWSFLKKAPVKE